MHRPFMMGCNLVFMLGTLLMAALMPATARSQSGSSHRPAVVELFTSQGCSSCPPADTLLGELARRPDVLALAFHVDYWDDLGWRDRFALPEAARRQHQYVQTLRLANAFTPQIIVDGQHSVLGSNRVGIVGLINRQRDEFPVVLDVVNEKLRIYLADRPERDRLDINVVAYLSEASSQIGRGENAGRLLREFNIVRAFRPLGVWQGQAKQLQLSLTTLPPDANRVAVIVQQPNQGAIVGAATIALHCTES